MKLIRKLGTRLDKNGKKQSWAVFECPFDNKEVEMRLGNGLRNKSCGYHKSCDGDYFTRLHRIWVGIKQRCFYKKHKFYKYYGGRGITVCNEWLVFIPFRDWSLNNGYVEGLEIHRENDGNYAPENCKWVTHKENMHHSRTTKINEEKRKEIRELYKTGNYTQQELAEKYNVIRKTIYRILHNDF